eukprot:GHVQ01015872.1.p1 GENE.GHVQ01015872.1~~GHVQ01015872.1.p1  ORF type:complete len:122 (-),score=19.20 GHVQ01015872.1:150-515(-)
MCYPDEQLCFLSKAVSHELVNGVCLFLICLPVMILCDTTHSRSTKPDKVGQLDKPEGEYDENQKELDETDQRIELDADSSLWGGGGGEARRITGGKHYAGQVQSCLGAVIVSCAICYTCCM